MRVFCPAETPLVVDPQILARTIVRLGLKTTYVIPAMLPARLTPERVNYLRDKIQSGGGSVNRDLVPVSYFFHSVLWASQFKGMESGILRRLVRIRPFWILDFPLLLALPLLVFLVLKKRRSKRGVFVPVAVMGFTSILIEMAVVIARIVLRVVILVGSEAAAVIVVGRLIVVSIVAVRPAACRQCRRARENQPKADNP